MQYLRTVYREHEINALVDLEQKLCSCCSWSWDLEYIGLVTNLGLVPFIPWGTSRESWREVKTIHNEKASTFHETLEVGVKDAGRHHLAMANNCICGAVCFFEESCKAISFCRGTIKGHRNHKK